MSSRFTDEELRPEVTQLVAELEFDLGLVALRLVFLRSDLVPPFIWCQLCAGFEAVCLEFP